mmetsp:Transcript_49867/g.116357  ORF Transcript_49867/g.116357 Transcript_49867/m.116357 type:complete len:415 (+) Transcript_49867:47-1291(+)
MAQAEVVLKDLQGALEQQRVSLEALHRRQSELSEENAALRDCLESVGILCGQAFLSRLHRRRFQRVLNQHPLSKNHQQASLEAVLRTPELAVNVASYSGPSTICPMLLTSRTAARGIAVATPELDRLFPASVYVIGGAGSLSNRPLRTMECFSPATGQSETRAPMLQPRCVCAAVACGEAIYAIGGRGVDGPLGSVECYYPAKDVWVAAPPLQRCSGWVAATSAWGGVCVAGGDREEATLDAVEFFQPSMRCWIPLPPMCTVRWASAAAFTANIAFVAGGYGHGEEVLAGVEFLALGSNEWQRLPNLPSPRAAHAMSAVGGKLYVAGGHGREDQALYSVERLDPHLGCWETLPSLDLLRGTLSSVSCGSNLYIFGGNKINSVVVERFNPQEGSWTSMGRLPTSRRCFAAVACRL